MKTNIIRISLVLVTVIAAMAFTTGCCCRKSNVKHVTAKSQLQNRCDPAVVAGMDMHIASDGKVTKNVTETMKSPAAAELELKKFEIEAKRDVAIAEANAKATARTTVVDRNWGNRAGYFGGNNAGYYNQQQPPIHYGVGNNGYYGGGSYGSGGPAGYNYTYGCVGGGRRR